MVPANAPDRPDPATSQNAALTQLRGNVLWGMGLFFVLAMGVVALSVTVGGMDDGSLPLRLGLVAVILPVAMAAPGDRPQAWCILGRPRARRQAVNRREA